MTLDPAISDVAPADKLNAPSHSDVHQDIKANLQRLLDSVPFVQQTALSGGPSSGTTVLSLGSITVPALDYDSVQYPSAFWTGAVDANGANDAWLFTIRDDNIAGAIRGALTNEENSESSANNKIPFGMPMAEGRVTPANTSRTYHVCIQRSTGDGTINTQGTGHQASVLVVPDLS